MLYLSRAEQVALVLLLVLLLAGTGLLVYSRGQRTGRADADLPLFVEAPAPRPGDLTRKGLRGAAAPEPESRTPQPTSSAPARPAAASAHRQPPTPSPTSRLRLNSATANELDDLPGIGPVLAQRILQYRQQLERQRGHGFESIDELLNVPGIGAKRLGAVRDLVTL